MGKRATRKERGRDAIAEQKNRAQTQLLKRLDPARKVDLEGTFTTHVADAILASSPTERQQVIDKAAEAYENALDHALYDILDKDLVDEDLTVG